MLGLGGNGSEARVQAAQAAEAAGPPGLPARGVGVPVGVPVRGGGGGGGGGGPEPRRAEVVAKQVGLGVLRGRVVALEDQLVVVERGGGCEARTQLARDEVVQAAGDGGEGEEGRRWEGVEGLEEDL